MEQRKKESGIRLEDVAAGYGRKALLNHISLHVSPGNVLTLIGPNGAGKSTILKTVTRQLAELGGTIFLEGTSMSRMREEEVARTLAMVMTERLHPEFMTCREVVATGRYPYTGRLGILSTEDWKLVDDAMQLVHARDTADRNFSQISDGQRQRVMLARAICQEPRILILDEPVDGLDPVMRRQIWSIILSEVAEKEMTVLVSSHNLRELEDVCDHVGIMHHGKIMIERSLSDLQGSVSKIQVACQSGMPKLPEHFQVLHMANTGRVYTMIVKGDPKEAEAALSYCNPTIVDVLPLTLEEIFIYEMGGADYEVKDILF